MRIHRYVLSILASLVLLTVWAPPAQAAVPKIPLTCGMVVQQDAVVVLKNDLTCPDFGVRVVQEPGAPGLGPHVIVDLRGHTLRGSGTADAISANNAGGSDFIQVINGRLKNWDTAISGDYDTRVKNVVLVGNRVGFFCEGICVADHTSFTRNSDTGLFVSFAADAKVSRSMFVRNGTGASVGFPWFLTITTSAFIRNEVGVLGLDSTVPISKSLFVKNQTAIRIDNSSEPGACADLNKVVFVKNGVKVDGPVCAP